MRRKQKEKRDIQELCEVKKVFNKLKLTKANILFEAENRN